MPNQSDRKKRPATPKSASPRTEGQGAGRGKAPRGRGAARQEGTEEVRGGRRATGGKSPARFQPPQPRESLPGGRGRRRPVAPPPAQDWDDDEEWVERRGRAEAPEAAAESSAPTRRGRPALGRSGARAGGRGGVAPAAEDKPERLHKLLAQSGVGSRREMEEWITAGRVNVNGETATLGQVVSPGDRVKVNGRLVNLKFAASRVPRVILYHKPEGQIVSRADPEGRESVFDALPRMRGGRWIAIGRLDYNTSGLLLFTTSGELANRLMHPRYNLRREYAARVLGEMEPEALAQLTQGVELEDGVAQFATLEDGGGQGANHWYRVSLFEGRNREVRRMFEAVGATVSRLIRLSYGPFVLPSNLKRGQVRELTEAEVAKLMGDFGLPVPKITPLRDKNKRR